MVVLHHVSVHLTESDSIFEKDKRSYTVHTIFDQTHVPPNLIANGWLPLQQSNS